MRWSTTVLTAALFAAPSLLHAAAPAAPQAHYVPGEVIVKYRDAVAAQRTDAGGQAKAAAMLDKNRLGMRTRAVLLDGRAELLELPAVMDVPGAIRTLAAEPAVEYAEPNWLRYPLSTPPNDALFVQQWGLHNTGQPNFVPCPPNPPCDVPESVEGADLNMLEAWDLGGTPRVGDPGVIVAILDEGFEVDHEDLAPNFLVSLAEGFRNPRPQIAAETHGTQVAGALGAVGNNGIGVAGTTWASSLLPLRVVNQNGNFSSARIAEAIQYARDNGAHIINASFGGANASQTERNLICGLADHGILFIAAAGNDDANLDFGRIGYPALYDCPNVIAVAATNRQDNIASFSMYGPLTVPVAAPGLQIVTTQRGGGWLTGNNCGQPGGSCGISGTSFATPYTAGIAALLRAHVTPDWREIKARLIESGTSLGNADAMVAGGRIDAAAAMDMDPRASLIIREVQILNDADRLVPGETVEIDVTLFNGWEAANNVVATLQAEGPVTVNSTAQNIPFIGADAQETVRFEVAVNAVSGHHYVLFTLQLEADDGYQAERSFVREVAQLPADGQALTQAFQPGDPDEATLDSSLYDEFHTWHVTVRPEDLPDPGGPNHLVVRTSTSNNIDIDLLGKLGEPPQYLITLGVDPTLPANRGVFFCTSSTASSCRDPETRISGEEHGNEEITFSIPAGAVLPQTYYFTVVNFAQSAFDYQIRAELSEGSGPGSSSSSGSMGLPALLLLLIFRLLPSPRGRREGPPIPR